MFASVEDARKQIDRASHHEQSSAMEKLNRLTKQHLSYFKRVPFQLGQPKLKTLKRTCQQTQETFFVTKEDERQRQSIHFSLFETECMGMLFIVYIKLSEQG